MNEQSMESVGKILNNLTVVGTFLLWAGFLLLGLIARRYEIVFKKWTGWKSLMLAPSGILIYVLLIVAQTLPQLPESIQKNMDRFAYGCLLVSALACLIFVERFYRVLVQITKPSKSQGGK